MKKQKGREGGLAVAEQGRKDGASERKPAAQPSLAMATQGGKEDEVGVAGAAAGDATYLQRVKELAALIAVQGEALQQGRWEKARRCQERARALQKEIDLAAGGEAVRAAVLDLLRQALAQVEAQRAALALCQEETAAGLAELCRWRRTLSVFRPPPAAVRGTGVDGRG